MVEATRSQTHENIDQPRNASTTRQIKKNQTGRLTTAAMFISAVAHEIIGLPKIFFKMSLSIEHLDPDKHSRKEASATQPTERIETDSNIPIILFVHGFLGNSGHWLYHKKYLQSNQQGHEISKNMFTVDLGTPFHSIEEYAAVVSKRIQEIKQATGRSDVILVSHSMGGLVSDAYQELFAKRDDVKIVDKITIGTPLSGTWTALLAALFSKAARQMLPSSSFSKKRAMKYVEKPTPSEAKKGIIKKTITLTQEKGNRVWVQKIYYNDRIERTRRIYGKDLSISEEQNKIYLKRLTLTSDPGKKETKTEQRERDKVLHIGSKGDLIVPSKSARHLSAMEEETISTVEEKELHKGGHLCQLTLPEAHKTISERILESINKKPLIQQ